MSPDNTPDNTTPNSWEELLARWQARLNNLPEEKIRALGVPVHIYVNEAHQYANTAQEYYETCTVDGQEKPGLRAVSFRFPETKIQEIHELADLVSYLQALALFGKTNALIRYREILDRANFLTDEIGDALEFHLDDDIEEPADKELANIQAHAKEIGNSASAVSELLLAYALLADSLRDRLDQDQTFDTTWIDEAQQVARELNKTPRPSAKDIKPFMQLRDRALSLLYECIHTLRKAANRVFRDYPDMKRKFSSTYERNRRAQQRALKKATPTTNSSATTPATSTSPAATPLAAAPTPTADAPASSNPTVTLTSHVPKNPK